jgi:hypothetical protein
MREMVFRIFSRIPKLRGLVNVILASLPAIHTGVRLGLRLRFQRSDAVWFCLQGEKPVITFLLISVLSGKKIILQQWDPISWWMEHRQHPARMISAVRKFVDYLERRAAVNLVPSEAWRDLLVSQGRRALKIDNFFTHEEIESSGAAVRVGSPFEINVVFAGQFYSNGELLELLKALKSRAHFVGRAVVLHYFGSSVPESALHGVRIVNHGHVERDELVRRIAKWDIALLPYPTNPRFDDASRLSFPSKSRIYLAAGLPILAYCKTDSSPHKFFSSHHTSYFCNVLAGDDVDGFLARAVDQSIEALCARTKVSKQLIKTAFSESAELAPFHHFLEELK